MVLTRLFHTNILCHLVWCIILQKEEQLIQSTNSNMGKKLVWGTLILSAILFTGTAILAVKTYSEHVAS